MMFSPGKSRIIYIFLLVSFLAGLFPASLWAAGSVASTALPAATPMLRAIRLDPKDPFRMEFIFDSPTGLSQKIVSRAVEYFLAALTMPEEDLWVNLSPYEQDRVVNDNLAKTTFGASLLKEDYVLKHLSASLTNPETEAGKKYWDEINNVGARSPRPGRGNPAPTNTFNKVWIIPVGAKVKENGYGAYIADSALKVLTQDDYLAMQKNNVGAKDHSPAANAFRKHILPLINQEVNQGRSFRELRQIYNAFVLATWLKRKIKDSIFTYYIDGKKVAGIDHADPQIKEKVYNAYLEMFKKGAYNFVKKERVVTRFIPSERFIKRQYFSGGERINSIGFNLTPGVIPPVRPGTLAAVQFTPRPDPKQDFTHQPRALSVFYGAEPENPRLTGAYYNDTIGEVGEIEDSADGFEMAEFNDAAVPIREGVRMYTHKTMGGPFASFATVVTIESPLFPIGHSLFYVFCGTDVSGLVMNKDLPLDGKVKPGEKISEAGEALETIFWMKHFDAYLAEKKWHEVFPCRYDERDGLSVRELCRLKALAKIVNEYGLHGLTPLQRRYIDTLDAASAARVLAEVKEVFLDRRPLIGKYLGKEAGGDGEALFDYINYFYIPALEKKARSPHALSSPYPTRGGIVVDSESIAVDRSQGRKIDISKAEMERLKASSGMDFTVEGIF